MNKKPNIKSSEFKSWHYCPRQWYLQRTQKRKVCNSATRRGVKFHNHMSHDVKAVQKAQKGLQVILLTGGIVCIFLLLSRF